MSEQPGQTRTNYWMLMALMVLGGIPLLLFLPLLLSNAEISIFGTEHVAQFFRTLGFGQFLAWFYRLFGL
jgi:hypothetical protein